MTDQEFLEGMEKGLFIKTDLHRAYNALLFYTGVRRNEARLTRKEQFSLQGNILFWDVGQREKHSKATEPLPLPLSLPYVDVIWKVIQYAKKGDRVFPFSDKTAYNIVRRVFKYPHFYRLSRITNFYEQGRTNTQLKSWTGLTLTALDSYAGRVDIMKMGKSLLDISAQSTIKEK
jgi:integrase